MFTGLIESVCEVKSVTRQGAAGGVRLVVDLGRLADGVGVGDSIAVNGVCLTVVRLDGGLAAFDVSGETFLRAEATLAQLKTSSKVNIERALKAGGRFGGHFVQGHVDGTAIIKKIDKNNQFADMEFSAERELLGQMVVKGSVAVDGVSLTITALTEKSFSISVIPHTLEETTLGKMRVGAAVNIETDIIIKAVKKQLENILPQAGGLSVDKLKELGF